MSFGRISIKEKLINLYSKQHEFNLCDTSDSLYINYFNIWRRRFLTHDYNRNPIVSRILFVRQGDEISLEEFAELRTRGIPKTELPPEESDFYEYTCHPGDVIRSMMLVSPDRNMDDLKREKKILE